jgi:hypothetical protein
MNGIVKLYDARSALLFRCIFREYYEVVADSDIGETLIHFGDKPKDMQDKISDLPVFGDTIYSPELFSDPNKTVESDDTTVCDNLSCISFGLSPKCIKVSPISLSATTS